MRQTGRGLRFARKLDWGTHFLGNSLGHFFKATLVDFNNTAQIVDTFFSRRFAPRRKRFARCSYCEINIRFRACRNRCIRLLIGWINDFDGLCFKRGPPCTVDIEIRFLIQIFLKHDETLQCFEFYPKGGEPPVSLVAAQTNRQL